MVWHVEESELSLLLQALSDPLRLAAELLNLVPAHLGNTVDIVLQRARNAIQRRPASAAQLVFVDQHAQCDTTADLV